MKLNKLIILKLILILTFATLHGQEIIKETYEIHPISWKNPLMSFEKKEILKAKFKEINNQNDTIVIHEIIKSIRADMHFRAKCYQVANDLDSNEETVILLKKKMHTLIKKWNFYLNLDYKIDKKYQEDLIKKNFADEELKKNFKDYKKELSDEINSLANEIDKKFPCPGGFKTVRGNLKFENGYLAFEPLKYRIFDSEDIKVKRIKSYFNGKDKYEDRKIGINLKSNELVRLKTKSSVFGALTMPFKVYISSKEKDSTRGNNVFTDANISLFYGRQWGYHGYNSKGELKRKKMHSFNFLFGVSKITLKKGNSKRIEDSDFNLLALNTGFAYGFSLNKFNIFIGTGLDFPFNSEGRKWYFDKQPWIGFGLGYTVFK